MVKITVNKKKMSRSAVYQPFFLVDGKVTNWPQVKGWIIPDWNDSDRFGNSSKVEYQNSAYDTVTFDGEKLSANKGPGIWVTKVLGQKIKGTWKSLDDIPSIFKTIPAKVATIHKKVLSTVPRFKDWSRTVEIDDGIVVYARSASTTVSASVTVYLEEILTDGEGLVDLAIDVKGGSAINSSFNIKSVSEIRGILEVANAIMKTQIQ